MSSYRKGARFERRVRKILESSGWFVGRQGKSAFPDLICLKRDIDKTTIMLAECKVNRSDITKEEREKLRKLSEELG
jgi:Holliday junction resolvase - archaeal type